MTEKNLTNEDGDKLRDYTIANELEQCTIVDKITEYAKGAESLVSEIKSGELDLDRLSINDLKAALDIRTHHDKEIDKTYSQLKSNYQQTVKNTYEEFKEINLCLIELLQDKLNEKMYGV